ncbi:hypothetical protein KEM56_000070 [Ascosphaera pollenicola]|nr:hypothetical protein KEM56_000070 [Ascosphaera pollenicola]
MAEAPTTPKTALVTGAGSGINFCFAQLLLSKGYNVIIADLALRPEAQALIDQYTESPKAIFVQTDVTSWKALRNMFDVAEKEFEGGLDIVCPGAGVFEPNFSNFWNPPGSEGSADDPFGDGYKTIDINLVHPIRVTQLAIEHWIKKQQPLKETKHILHLTSIAGQVPLFATPIYSATKHGLSGFIRSLAPLSEVSIQVTGVAPAIVKTPLWTEDKDKMACIDPSQGDWVLPEEVARVMLAMIEQETINSHVLKGEEHEASEEATTIQVKPGMIVQVSKKLREVLTYGDPGPSHDPGVTLSDFKAAAQATLEKLK